MTRQAVWVLLALVAIGQSAGRGFGDDLQVALPFIFHDERGSTWDVQFDGSIGDGGNDLYDGGGRLFINNSAQYQSQGTQITRDASGNELTFPAAPIAGLNVSRKVAWLY